MKILCLHGMGQNSRIFEAQTNKILQPLREEGHEFIFVDGIVPYDPPDERLKAMYGPPYLAYYSNEAEFCEAADIVRDHLDEDGPFDGVFAFSQGCHLATALMSATPHDESNGQLFRFAVFMGAGPSPEFALENGKRERSLDVPVLHVIGRNDRQRLQSREYVSMHSDALDSVVLEHDGRHHVPTDMVVSYGITRYIKNRVSGGQVAA